jgi:chromosome segregation ATPase
VKGHIGGILERILSHMGHTTTREQALVLELAQVKDQLGAATSRAEAFRVIAEERLSLLEAATALADERVGLIAAAATRAENIQKQLDSERKERAPAANHMVRLELRVQALKRRRERLRAELCKFQDQLARADVSGRIRELQEERAQLQRRLADLQTYATLRVEPPHGAANGTGEKQGSANPR